MQQLILRPGPQLVMRAFRPETDDTGSRLKEVDVTGRAHEHLFELVTVHAETTLADIFRLMEASPLLQKFFRRDFAGELCAEARKGAAEPPARERAAHEGIEFLELYQEWGLDTSTNEYSGMQRLHLHGIGHELAEDLPDLSDFASCGLPEDIADTTQGLQALHSAWDAWVVPAICSRYGLADLSTTMLLVDLFDAIERQGPKQVH